MVYISRWKQGEEDTKNGDKEEKYKLGEKESVRKEELKSKPRERAAEGGRGKTD